MLLSLPVIVNREITALSGVVLDRSAVVSAVGPVDVAVDNSVFFTATRGIACDMEVGFNVVRPDRIAKFTVDRHRQLSRDGSGWLVAARIRLDAGIAAQPQGRPGSGLVVGARPTTKRVTGELMSGPAIGATAGAGPGVRDATVRLCGRPLEPRPEMARPLVRHCGSCLPIAMGGHNNSGSRCGAQ